MKVYHYTKESHLEKILSDGFIRVDPTIPPILGLVWLTSEKFIPNICRPQDNTLTPARFVDVGYYRFIFDSLNPLIKRWVSYQRTIKGARESVATLNQTARGLIDNPKKWFVSEKPLPIEKHEEAAADPEVNFLLDGQSINYFAP